MDKKNREGLVHILERQLSILDMQLEYMLYKTKRKQDTDMLRPITENKKAIHKEAERKEERIQLTYEQKRLYIQACQDEKSNISYNQCMLFRVEGEFYTEYLQEIVNEICENHDILRTGKIDEDYLYLSRESQISVVQIDMTGNQDEERKQAIKFVQDEMEVEFHFASDRFLKPYILKLSNSVHMIFIKVHHIVADGWSLNTILCDMLDLYQQKLQGTRIQLPKSPQYKEYQQKLQKESMSVFREDAIQYWKGKLKKRTEDIEFPGNQNRERDEVAGFEETVLSGELYTRIKQYCKENGTSLFQMLLSVYTVFINRVLEVESFVIGIPFSGQLKYEMERLVGHCVNMRPLYVFMDDNVSFQSHMNQMKKELIEVSRYQLFSINEMIEEVIKEEEHIYFPNIEIAFNLDKVVVDGFEIKDTKIISERPDQYVRESMYNFFLDVLEQKEQLVIRIIYNRNAILKEIAGLWLEYLKNIVYNVIQDSSVKIYEIELDEYRQEE